MGRKLNHSKKSLREALAGKLTEEELTKLLGPDSNSTDSDEKFGTFTDPRDGKTYKTVKIGNQVWLAENLAYKPSSGDYWAYNDDQSNIVKYGYLYDWKTAMKVVPTGWHLPSDEEWNTLTNYIDKEKGPFPNSGGAKTGLGLYLKSTSGWKGKGDGNDFYGFRGLPGGYRHANGTFYFIGEISYWWSSTTINGSDSWYRVLDLNDGEWKRCSHVQYIGLNVRVIKD